MTFLTGNNGLNYIASIEISRRTNQQLYTFKSKETVLKLNNYKYANLFTILIAYYKNLIDEIKKK
jgi:hypothetical protein